jgi:hypothetical protein
MKTKARYTLGIAALVFALAACTELTEPGELSGETMPPGMGLAYIQLDHQNARTTLPGLTGLHFTLDFKQGTDSKTESLKDGLTTLTVALESGIWNLEVKGYSSEGRLTVGGTGSVTITAGISSNVVVNLKPVFTEGGTGILDYNSVSFPPTVKQAFLTMNAPGTSEKIDLLKIDEEKSEEETDEEETTETEGTKEPPAPGTRALPAGSYQALIDLYDNTTHKAAVWTGLVHIYDGSTTTLVQTFDTPNFASPQVVGKDETTLEGKLQAAFDFGLGSCTIVLDDQVTSLTELDPQTLWAKDGNAIAITIEGNGQTLQVKNTGTPLFTLGAEEDSSLTLVLEDVTLKGKDGNTASLVQVNSGGTLDLEEGSVITGNTSTANGGGVYVASGGTLNLNGGEISGNISTQSTSKGGGVYVGTGGTFIMSDGKISGNSTPSSSTGSQNGGAGVYVAGGGTFKMSDGEISNNKAYVDGGGVLVRGGTFEMSGGEISGNSSSYGGGVYLSGGTFTMTGGVIYGSGTENGTKANKADGAALFNNTARTNSNIYKFPL